MHAKRASGESDRSHRRAVEALAVAPWAPDRAATTRAVHGGASRGADGGPVRTLIGRAGGGVDRMALIVVGDGGGAAAMVTTRRPRRCSPARVRRARERRLWKAENVERFFSSHGPRG
jgi:hypothetical protein